MKKIFITESENDTLIVRDFLKKTMSVFNEFVFNNEHIFEVDEMDYDSLIIKQHIYFSQFKHKIKYFDFSENVVPSGYSTIGTFIIDDKYLDKIEHILVLLRKWFIYYDIQVINCDSSQNRYTFIINNLDESSNKIDMKEFINTMRILGVEIFLEAELELERTYTYQKRLNT